MGISETASITCIYNDFSFSDIHCPGHFKNRSFLLIPQPQAGQIYYLYPSIEMGTQVPEWQEQLTCGQVWGEGTEPKRLSLVFQELGYTIFKYRGWYTKFKGTLDITDYTQILQLEQTEPMRWQELSLLTEPGSQEFFTPGLNVHSPGLGCLSFLHCLENIEF